jgi:predicted Zn-dependent protease
MGSQSARRKSIVVASAISMLPSAAVVTLAGLRWWRAPATWMATLGGVALFGALTISIGRIAVRTFMRREQIEAPRRAYLTAMPIAAIVFAPLVVNIFRNAFIRTSGLPMELSTLLLPAIACSFVLALAYDYPILNAARALATDALDGLETALLGGAVSLGVTSNFLRLACEAQHFHADARRIGTALGGASLAFAAAGTIAAYRRWKWARAAFRKSDGENGVIAWDASLHAGVPPLDVDGRGEGDGVIVRFGNDAKAPYRDAAHAVPIARTWLDQRRALAPLVRRVLGCNIMLVASTFSTIVVAGGRSDTVHLEREDLAATTPSGPLGFPASCTRRDLIVFVAVGELHGVDLDALAKRYGETYGRQFVVAPPQPLPAGSYDPSRHQWSANAILADLRRRGISPSPVVIAITSADLYIDNVNWGFAFGMRMDAHLAVVSNARMREALPSSNPPDAVADYRLRKMITRDLAILYCSQQPYDNPESMLSKQNMSLYDLDRMDESVW